MKHHIVKRYFSSFRKRFFLLLVGLTVFIYISLPFKLPCSCILANSKENTSRLDIHCIRHDEKQPELQHQNLTIRELLHMEWKNYLQSVEEFKERFAKLDKKYLKTRKQSTNYTYFEYGNLALFRDYLNENGVPEQNRFTNTDVNTLPEYTLQEDKTTYFLKHENLTCFVEGTNWQKMHQVSPQCECLNGWYGKWCSFPEELQAAKLNKVHINTILPRETPVRLINCFPFNIELEMLEIRLAELHDVVDIFIIVESNYTGYGDPKPLYLLSALQKGFLQQYHHMILYHYMDYFPDEAYINGWTSDNIRYDELSEVLRSGVHGIREDDLVMLTDADEVPSRNSLLFLKNHEGYDEPVGFKLVKNTFGFFWKDRKPTNLMSVSTYAMTSQVYNHIIRYQRNPDAGFKDKEKALEKYKASGHRVKPWFLGNDTYYAGWHCSYCFTLEALRTKLQSIINEDYPRYGDNPENFEISRLKHLIGQGFWFDENSKFIPVNFTNFQFTTQYALTQSRRFDHLLINRYNGTS